MSNEVKPEEVKQEQIAKAPDKMQGIVLTKQEYNMIYNFFVNDDKYKFADIRPYVNILESKPPREITITNA